MSDKPDQKPFEFERSLKELEAIAAWFESADADIDKGITKFEEGMVLAAGLKDHLDQLENRVERIKQRFAPAPAAE